MKLSGVKFIFLGEFVEAVGFLISIIFDSVLYVLLGDTGLALASEYAWCYVLPRDYVTLFFFWQSCRILKDSNVHFKKALVLPWITAVLRLVDYIHIPWSWLDAICMVPCSVVNMMTYYHLFVGLSELAQRSKQPLLAKNLKRLFIIKLVMWPVLFILLLTIGSPISHILYYIKGTNPPQTVPIIIGLSILWILALPFYHHILKWLYRANTCLNAQTKRKGKDK